MNTKTCTKCGRTLPLEMFHRTRSVKCGRMARCKDCVNELARANCRTTLIPAGEPLDGIISPAEAARICRDITGHKVAGSYIRGQADKFPQIARWRAGNTGGNKFIGIIRASFVNLVQGRLAIRGRHAALKDIFSTGDI